MNPNCSRCGELALSPERQLITFGHDDYGLCGGCLEELRRFMSGDEAGLVEPSPMTAL